ncbi:MAG: hypothetical protein K6F50_00480 [Kiritimatiellae bacterium]|nr:hypothetical protein [Kiritimatiellia bacterium]
MTGLILLAAALNVSTNGIELAVSSETESVDPGRSVFVTVTATAPKGVELALPDIGARARGFGSSEAFADEPSTDRNGTVTQTVNWKLVPEPCAERYRIAPFVVTASRGGTDLSFIAGPLYFEQPAARAKVEGGIEIDPQKDSPPFSWKRVGRWALWLLAAVPVVAALWFAVRYLMRRVKEHLMSPIERAWVELDRLIAKGLPGRGKYKDFYVELTMVVRRYVQRKYGIKAPHLTTEEFLRELGGGRISAVNGRERLREFLESADLVKFAGVEATPEMADGATSSARAYLKDDSGSESTGKGGAA